MGAPRAPFCHYSVTTSAIDIGLYASGMLQWFYGSSLLVPSQLTSPPAASFCAPTCHYTCQMPNTVQEKKERPYGFKFDEEAAALVHLLRHASPADFKKYCPDLEQHGACTGVDDMFAQPRAR